MASRCQQLAFTQGEKIFNEGDDQRFSLLLEQGSLEIYRDTRQGEEKVFQILGPGQWVALAAVFMDHGRFPMNARARADGCGVRIPHALLHDLCLRYPALTLGFLHHFCNQLYATLNHVDWLTSSSAAERLTAWLVDFSHNGEQLALHLPLSRAQLAARLGMRSETLCRLLSQWRKEHIISGVGNRMQLENITFLQTLSQGARRQF
ncbi:Crp/Fnr family transcriptional regulator [Candidatus Sodalis pierantonius]|uniref:Crp/Fnr family transcriptional regulator n=1 Tax=Candidatus Sodalis pierantonii TaxID=1486991 RepID=UPI00214EE0A3|nr:Crp/Fnr family transcriptional regulator [Candidatus Sodalis pierantonius]